MNKVKAPPTIKRIMIMQEHTLSDGEYRGVWCGYSIETNAEHNRVIKIQTETGIRGAMPVLFTIKDNQITELKA